MARFVGDEKPFPVAAGGADPVQVSANGLDCAVAVGRQIGAYRGAESSQRDLFEASRGISWHFSLGDEERVRQQGDDVPVGGGVLNPM